jgi:CBS domain-containing protein
MKVSEIMSVGVQTVSPGTPAANARERMRTKKIHHLVVMQKTELVGVLSARDLARIGRRGNTAPKLLVADFMTPRIVTVAPDTSIHRAANVMRGHSIGCVVVVEGGRAVGIVTLSDLLDQVAEKRRHRHDKHTPPALNFRVPHEKQHRAGGSW